MSILFFPQNLSKCIQLKSLHRKQWLLNIKRCFSKELPLERTKEGEKTRILPFQEVISRRRDEANRSILVQVQSAQSFKELHSYCSSHGTVNSMLHYTTGAEPMHFIIVEFSKESDVSNIFSASSYIEDSQVVPVQSQFLWFRASSKKGKLKNGKHSKLCLENGTNIPSDAEIVAALKTATDESDQMIQLHEMTKLNDVGIRLRFMVAKQIESAVLGMFPTATALPFGSSVNGCGRMGCDLDLVLRLNNNEMMMSEENRLVYHCKAAVGSERTVSQRHMEAIGDLIQLFLPGCSQVRRILQARVPIIKYYQQLTDVECDLSMTNMSGVHMSDFLYLMGSIDERVRPLVFTVRKWAAEVGLTNSSPGRWISNFSLTLLVLAFFQTRHRSPAILPSLNTLVKMASKNDKYITEDGINCTFLRDINKYVINNPTSNIDSLKSLLLQFFEYYSHFDFSSKAVCLNEAVPITKPDHSALYIVNPLERGLNVSKNVSLEELEKFKMEVRNAAWLLETEGVKSPSWGILPLFATKKKSATTNNSHSSRHPKLLIVSKLFEDDDYKNDNVKKQVDSIKKETKTQVKKLERLDLSRQKSGR